MGFRSRRGDGGAGKSGKKARRRAASSWDFWDEIDEDGEGWKHNNDTAKDDEEGDGEGQQEAIDRR
jgi:hypothetical protein